MEPLTLIIFFTLAAAVLIVGDLFVPSGGILSIVGVGLLVAVVIICFTINRWLGVAVLFSGVVASPFVVAGLLKAWQYTPVGKRMVLAEHLEEPVHEVVRVGSAGQTLTALRPMGEAEFAVEAGPSVVVQARSEFGSLEPQTPVTVVHFHDGVATVRAAESTAESAAHQTTTAASAS